jgi:hypothetical protein
MVHRTQHIGKQKKSRIIWKSTDYNVNFADGKD